MNGGDEDEGEVSASGRDLYQFGKKKTMNSMDLVFEMTV